MIQAFLARQLARPSGPFGRWVVARLMNRANRRMNRLALAQLAPGPDDRVLEIGFGGGALLERLLAAGCARVAGVDPSAEMLAGARRRFHLPLEAGRVELRGGTAEALPFAGGAFTRVCSVNTLYFWPDVPGALAECRRVLAPGGVLVLCFNDRADMERWPGHRHGFRLYERAEVEDQLRTAGFGEVLAARGEDPAQGVFHAVRGVVPASS